MSNTNYRKLSLVTASAFSNGTPVDFIQKLVYTVNIPINAPAGTAISLGTLPPSVGAIMVANAKTDVQLAGATAISAGVAATVVSATNLFNSITVANAFAGNSTVPSYSVTTDRVLTVTPVGANVTIGATFTLTLLAYVRD